MTETNIVDVITKRFNNARSNELPWFNKFDRWYGLYRNVQQIKNYYGRANLFIPASFWTVESFVPRITRALRGIIATAQDEKNQDNADAVTGLLEYQKEEIGWEDFFNQWVRLSGIYGTSFGKVSWDYHKSDKKADKPRLDIVDILDFFYDPNASKMEEARWAIHRTQKHIEELIATGKYFNLEKIMPRGSAPQDEGFKARRKALISVLQKPYDSTAKLVDVYEFWGWINLGTETQPDNQNMLITVANKNTVIRMEKNPFADILPGNALPFVALYDTDIPFEFYGMGEIEPIESLQQELNDTRNQRMDNVTLILNRMWEVIRSADVSEEDFVSIPGKVFYSNIPNGVREIQTPDVTQSAYTEEKLIKEDIQQTIIGTPNTDIPAMNKSETATGILAVQEAGDTRTEYKVKNMKLAVKKVWRMILALDQELLDKDFVVRLKGQQGVAFKKMKPSDIQGNFDIDIEVESQQNRLVKKQEAMQLFQLALKTPNANIPKAYTDLLHLFDKPNPAEYLVQPPPPQPPVPQVSISLRGELAPQEVDEFAKRSGADASATDPMWRPEFRRMMFPNSKEGLQPDEQMNPEIMQALTQGQPTQAGGGTGGNPQGQP